MSMERQRHIGPWIWLLLVLPGCDSGNPSPEDTDTETDIVEDSMSDPDEEEIVAEDTSRPETECSSDIDCDDGDVCTKDTCILDFGICSNDPVDGDGDGYMAAMVEGTDCGGTDCDDEHDDVYPGAPPACSEIDHDCSGAADHDEDGDGFLNLLLCPDGGDDCDDARDDVHPGAEPQCSSIDHDCSGAPDEDEDGDGYLSVDRCPFMGTDCDDTRADIHPDATPACDGVDHDCSGAPDDDEDSDGYLSMMRCPGTGDDCDDTNPLAHPGAVMACAWFDADCDGVVEDDLDGDGHVATGCGGDDCDDEDPLVYEGALELACDGKDTDCNGEMTPTEDADIDGSPNETCAPAGVTPDCNDDDASIHPGAAELCDAVDQDCDGRWEDGPGVDDDLDGFLDSVCGGSDCDDTRPDAHPGAASACQSFDADCDGRIESDLDADGHVSVLCGGDDCDDENEAAHPLVIPACQGFDADCDGITENDHDGDGHIAEFCGGMDCDDEDSTMNPWAIETCDDGLDSDCDGATDSPVRMLFHNRISDSGLTAQGPPRVVHVDDGFVVTYSDDSGHVMLQMVSAFGSATTSPVDLVPGYAPGYGPASMAFTGREIGVVWESRYGTTFARVDLDGTRIGTPVLLASYGYHSDIAWTGTVYAVLIYSSFSMMPELVLHRLGPDGVVLPTANLIVDGSDGNLVNARPEMVWTGSVLTAVWLGTHTGVSDVYSSTFYQDGSSTGPHIRLTSLISESSSPSIAWTGSDMALTWTDDRETPAGSVYFKTYSIDGSFIGDAVAVSPVGTEATSPTIAWTGVWGGVLHGICWASAGDILCSSLSSDGTVVSSITNVTDFSPLAHLYESNASVNPVMVPGDGGFGIAWLGNDSRVTSTISVFFNLLWMCE